MSAVSETVEFAVEGLDPAGRWLVIGCWNDHGRSENPTPSREEAARLMAEFSERIQAKEQGLGWRDVRLVQITTTRAVIVSRGQSIPLQASVTF